MPKFGAVSESHLVGVDPRLVAVARKVVTVWDCSIIDGIRTIEEQRKNVARGVSKTMASKHLPQPPSGLGHAFDVMPYPYDWRLIETGLNAIKKVDGGMQIAEVYAFAGFFDGVAFQMGYNLRSGIDWNTNRQFDDQTFHDLPHHELKG